MLSKKDLIEIRAIIKDELRTCFGRTVQIEKGPRQQGDPERRLETEDVDLVSFLILYLPRIEAAMRGLQADVDRTVNSVDRQHLQVEALGSALLSFEQPIRALAQARAAMPALQFVSLPTAELVNKPIG